jgi:hypothetical protein
MDIEAGVFVVVTSITGGGADTIGRLANSPIQSTCRCPCINTARPVSGATPRTNQLPLMRALPMRIDKALAAQGFVVDSSTGSLGSQLEPLTIALNSER